MEDIGRNRPIVLIPISKPKRLLRLYLGIPEEIEILLQVDRLSSEVSFNNCDF